MLIDAFMFFQEVDLLELRLYELDSVVDKFVIVESIESHGSSIRKFSSVLQAHWSVVKPFEHKIKFVLLDSLEPPFNGSNHWDRENYNRNSLFVPALEVSTSKQDILMVSDLDEIPRAKVIDYEQYRIVRGGLYSLNQEFFYYNVNNHLGQWNGTIIGTIDSFQQGGGLQVARNRRDNLPHIRSAGWHFSYFGDISRIRNKVANFAHSSDSPIKNMMARSDAEVAGDIAAGRDLYRRPGEPTCVNKWASDDSRLPAYYLANREKFQHFTEDWFKKVNADLL